MTVIIVSGTPGTGKTTYAKKLAKEMKVKYVNVNKVIDDLNLSEGFDKERDTKIIDISKLKKALIELIKKEKDVVIDSHLSHYLPNKFVDKCIITKCNLKELKARLENRGYSKKKVRENLDAEIFDVCRVEAKENGHHIEIIDTSTQKH
ncbi:MAG: adenylate kinase family protein [archaeon]